jgi:opacity protein-like surface antigen
MNRFYRCDRVLARSSIALCCSIPLNCGVGDVKAAWSGERSRPPHLTQTNGVKRRNLLLGAPPIAPLRYGSMTTKLESIELLNRRDRWYGGFGIGVTAPNLSSDGQIRGLEIPFRLDVNTDRQTSLNAFVGRRFSNFRVEAEVLSTNNSLKDAELTFVSAPALNNRITSGKVSNFSVMINGYYDLDIGSAVKPFIGAGIGYSFTTSSIRSVPFPLEGTTSGLSVQLKVGAAYTLFDRTDIYAQYRYLNTPVSTQVNGDVNGNNLTGNISGNLNSSIFEVGTRFNF